MKRGWFYEEGVGFKGILLLHTVPFPFAFCSEGYGLGAVHKTLDETAQLFQTLYIDHVTPQTLLLEKRRQMVEVQKQLDELGIRVLPPKV